MTLTLPYPPTANLYWRHNRGRIHISAEAMAFKRTVAIRAYGVKPLDGDVDVTLDVYRPAKRGDLDNTLKVLIDSLRGIAYADDKQIVRIEARRHEDKAMPRVEVTVTPSPTAPARAGGRT